MKRNWHAYHSWQTEFNFKNQSQKYSGTNSISVRYKAGYAGFVLFLANLNVSGYDTLVFWVNGGNGGGQSFWIKVSFDGKTFSQGKNSTDYVHIEANKWQQVKIPIQDLMDGNFYIVSLLFQENKGYGQNEFFIDEIYLNSIQGNPKILDTKLSSYNFYPSDKIKISSIISDPEYITNIKKVILDCNQIFPGLITSLSYKKEDDPSLSVIGKFEGEVLIPENSSYGEKRITLIAEDFSGKKAFQEIWVGVMKKDTIPIPLGLPKYLAIGTATTASNLSWQTNNGNECWDMGYQYITWGWWNWHYEFVKRFCDDAYRRGYIPVIPLYLFQTAPQEFGCTGSEYEIIYCAINNQSLMNEFWKRFIQMCQEAKRSFSQKVIFHIEPDMLGYLQQRCTNENKTPDQIPAIVNDPKYPNNLTGMHQRMIDLVREHCSNKGLIAFHASLWGNIISLKDNEEKILDLEKLAQNTADILLQLSPDFDIIFIDWSDRDAGYDEIWWDKRNTSVPNFSRVLMFTNYLSHFTKKKVILWQIPIGNENLPNVTNQYADNRLDYVFDYPVDIAKSGIIALLFGAGIPNMTTQFTDGGYLKARAIEYCQKGKVNLYDLDKRDTISQKPPKEIIFYQNYPNPFSSYTYLKFELPELKDENEPLSNSTKLSIKIYNILGEYIAEITNDHFSAGKHEIKFHPNRFNLSSGVYLFELNYGKMKKMIKVVVVK